MSDFEVRFNTAQLLAGAEAAFNEANMVLGREFQKRITSNIWAWPTGQSPRDIVAPNSGQLRDSYTPTPITPVVFEHAWNTEYAMAVHEGAVRKTGNTTVTTPARPWVRVTLRDFKFADAYARLAQAEMERRTRGL